jgi:hypothetical protein
MGLGGIIKSAFHAAENVFHKAENDVKKTVQTVEKNTARQVTSFVGNVASQINKAETQVAKFVPNIPFKPPTPPKPKGFFDKLLDKGKNFVNNVGNFGNNLVEKGKNVLNKFADFGTKALNKVADFGSKALNFGKNLLNEVKTRGLDIGKSLLNVVTEGVGGLVRSTFEGIGKVASGVGNMLNPAPLGKLFSGDFKGAWEDFKGNVSKGAEQIGNGLIQATVQGPFDMLAVTLQNGISAVQTAIGVETPGRSLTAAEQSELKKVYGDKVDLSQIRIKEDNIGLNNLMAPHTVGNTIYIPKGWLPDPSSANYQQQRNELLVHETAHTWQYQNGGTDYIGSSIWNQLKGAVSGGSRDAAYEYDQPIKAGKSWTELNPEQQAHLIENAYVQGLFDNPNATFRLKDGTDATAYVRDAIEQMRNGKGAA